MREIQDILDRRARSSSAFVLGTLVDLRGSGYRRPGARILIAESGERVGMISGGCLERDVASRAFDWTAEGPALVLYDTRSDELYPHGRYGTGCEGMVYVLLERVGACARLDSLDVFERVYATRRHEAMATLYAHEGFDDSVLGTRWLRSDEVISTDASAALDGTFRARVAAALDDLRPGQRPGSLLIKDGERSVTVLLELIEPPPELVIFGGGDDVPALTRLSAAMGWRSRVITRWPSRADVARFPGATSVQHVPFERALEGLELSSSSYALLMTHHLPSDRALLPGLLGSDASYIGLLGPRRRTAQLLRSLQQHGELPSADQLARLHTPVGLDIGGHHPEEVALSILAELAASRHGRDGGRLQHNAGPIHDVHQTRTIAIEADDLDEEVAS